MGSPTTSADESVQGVVLRLAARRGWKREFGWNSSRQLLHEWGMKRGRKPSESCANVYSVWKWTARERRTAKGLRQRRKQCRHPVSYSKAGKRRTGLRTHSTDQLPPRANLLLEELFSSSSHQRVLDQARKRDSYANDDWVFLPFVSSDSRGLILREQNVLREIPGSGTSSNDRCVVYDRNIILVLVRSSLKWFNFVTVDCTVIGLVQSRHDTFQLIDQINLLNDEDLPRGSL